MEILYNLPLLQMLAHYASILKREHILRVRHLLHRNQHFGPQLTILCTKAGIRLIEIPVNYRPRVGHSSVTGSLKKSLVLGFKMIALILLYRFKKIHFPSIDKKV